MLRPFDELARSVIAFGAGLANLRGRKAESPLLFISKEPVS